MPCFCFSGSFQTMTGSSAARPGLQVKNST